MRRKWLMLGVVLTLCVIVALLPRYPKVDTSVVHQHQSYPAENKEITGFDENGVLTSHLPLIVLKAGGNVIPGADRPTDQELYCEFAVIDNNNQTMPQRKPAEWRLTFVEILHVIFPKNNMQSER